MTPQLPQSSSFSIPFIYTRDCYNDERLLLHDSRDAIFQSAESGLIQPNGRVLIWSSDFNLDCYSIVRVYLWMVLSLLLRLILIKFLLCMLYCMEIVRRLWSNRCLHGFMLVRFNILSIYIYIYRFTYCISSIA